MFPSRGELHIALFNDEALYIEQTSKANFWCQESFHGVNLSSLRPQALVEIFKQPVVVCYLFSHNVVNGGDTFGISIVHFQTENREMLS